MILIILGSRRPTVLEFRHVHRNESTWYIRDSNNAWQVHPIRKVVQIVGEAHESLGATVSAVPIYVRVESPHCVDMQVVDLPGFRDFSLDDRKADLATQIDELVTSFMKDSRNVMVCVEQAGDAANMSTLARCQRIDPHYNRTILVRNKLDKFYGDLSFENVNPWLDGFGDLPASLPKFTLTLPHWTEKGRNGETLDPPAPFVQLRKQMSDKDQQELKSKGAASKHLEFIGFERFAKMMEIKIEALFAQAIGPIVKRLKEMEGQQLKKIEVMLNEVRDTNPDTMIQTVREAGKSFAQALSHVLEGVVTSTVHRQTLPEEMHEFVKHVKDNGIDIDLLPSEHFSDVDEYLEFLCNEVRIPAWDMPINGGAQYRRLVLELEAYIRLAENNHAASRVDVVQARGVSLNAVTWKEVVMKLLSSQAHAAMKRRMRYVAARLEFCFMKQGEVALEFMSRVAGAPDEHLYSSLLSKHSKLIEGNPLIRKLVVDAFFDCISHHTKEFENLYFQTLKSTFSNPFAFMKKTPFQDADPFAELNGPRELPTFDDTRQRVPEEMSLRGSVEGLLNTWLADVPNEPSRIDESVDKVQILLNLVFSAVRSQLADSLELYAESFFKMPVIRRIEDQMADIELKDTDKDAYKSRRGNLKVELQNLEDGSKVVKECLDKLQSFALQTRAVGK